MSEYFMHPTVVELFGVAALAGVAAHLGVFIRGEWHIHGPAIVLAHLTLLAFAVLGTMYCGLFELKTFAQTVALIASGYCTALLISISTYRLYFHRLTQAGFPGPRAARLSKLWHMWACRTSQNHLVLSELHRKYGDFVRTGPNEITVFDPDVYRAVDGPKNDCIKSDWYDILHPNLALVTCRAKDSHRARRRQWSQGFSNNSVDLYEAKTLKHVEELDLCIESDVMSGKVSEATDLFQWFAFDAMGDFVFNRSFNMLHNQGWHDVVRGLNRALDLLGPMSSVPWLAQLGFKLLPRVGILKDWFNTIAFCERMMRERSEQLNDDEDLAHYLLKDAKENGYRDMDWMWLTGDGLFAIVAGSDPAASTLVGIFNELARHPGHVEKMYEELHDLDTNDPKRLQKAPHFNAVISEVLRLYPALPTGGNRITSELGLTIGDTFVPPHTTIAAPRYCISRREDCYEKADQFIPERWYERPEMIINKAAYAPFGTGNHTCLGRFLALDEIRMVTARLVKRYRVRFAPGEAGDCVTTQMRDRFTSNPGRLRLIFELREKS